jgi:hypothetical protein
VLLALLAVVAATRRSGPQPELLPAADWNRPGDWFKCR